MVSDDELRRRADLAFEVAAHPIRNVSAYYMLYYLAKVEGIDRVVFDWQQHRDYLHDGFYWYGLYAVANEMTNVIDHFWLDGQSADQAALDRDPTERPEALRAFGGDLAERYCPDYRGLTEWWLQEVFFREVPSTTAESEVDVEEMFRALDYGKPYLEHPSVFFDWVAAFMSNSPSLEAQAPDIGTIHNRGYEDHYHYGEEHGLSGWASNYDGPKWVAIADHMSVHDTTNPTVWVDTCIALKHNTGNWLNKVQWDPAERQKASDLGHEPAWIFDDVLNAGADANMELLAHVALQFREFYDFNLERTLNELWGRDWTRYYDA